MRKLLGIIAALLIVTSGVGGAAGAAEQIDFQIQAGAISPTNPDAPYEYTRYYPDELKVHRGQTIQWNFVENLPLGFHTVTFLASGAPGYWRVDDIPETYAFPEEGFFGSGCGRAAQNACVLDGSEAWISSGVGPISAASSPFRVTIAEEIPLGDYTYFCGIHSGMHGSLEVVADDVPLLTQSEIDLTVEGQIADDTAAADSVFEAGLTPESRLDPENPDRRIWTVRVGDATEDHHVYIDSYLPPSLPIQAGDKVHFRIPEASDGSLLKNELHTVTFPGEVGVNGVGFAFYPACDPDDPATGAKGIPGGWGQLGPDCPFNTEFLFADRLTHPVAAPQNQVLTPATFHDSGALMSPGAPDGFRTLPDTGRELPSTFDAGFPAPGTFTFACNIHEHFMTGSITVS